MKVEQKDTAGTNPLANAAADIENIKNLACPERVEGVERFKRIALLTTYYISTLSRSAATNNNQIDKLVYELYGLRDDEIGIVKGAG